MDVDTKIRKVLNMVNGADKRVFAEALRDPREFGTRARTPLEALQEVDTALIDLYLESEQNADTFVEGLKKMGSILEPGAPLVCCNYFNILTVKLGLAQFDEAVKLLLEHSPRRKDEMDRLRIVVEARAKASPDSLATICVLIFGEGWTSRRGAYSEPCEVNAKIDKRQLYQALFGVFAALELDPSSEFYVLRTSAEPDKFIQWALEGVGAVMGRSLVGEKLAYLCSNAQICCSLRHPLRPSKRISNTKDDLRYCEHFEWDGLADDDSDDEEEDDEKDEKFDYFATADAVEAVDDSYAERFEGYVFAVTDAYAACGRRLEPACVEGIVEVIGIDVMKGIIGVSATAFLPIWAELVQGVAPGAGLFADVDACDSAPRTNDERQTLRAVIEALQVPRDHRDGQTVDDERLAVGLRLEALVHDAGVHVRTDGLAPWDDITIFASLPHAKNFYFAAQDAGYDVSRAWAVDLYQCIRRVDGLTPSNTLAVLTHALPLTQRGALLREATVLLTACEAAGPGVNWHRKGALGALLEGDRNSDPALKAVLTKLEEKGFHSGPIAAYDDVVDPEMTKLLKDFCSAAGTTAAKAQALVDALKNVDGLFYKPTLRLFIEAVSGARGAALAPGNLDRLRRAADETDEPMRFCQKFQTRKTLMPLLKLLYADSDEAVLEKKATLIKALDDANVHGQDVALMDYEPRKVGGGQSLPDYVTALYEAGKKAGLSFTDEDAATLYKEVGSEPKEGLDGCFAKFVLEVLAARLLAGQCNGRALEDKGRLAQACLDAGLRISLNNVLMHLLNPLNEEDGDEPSGNSAKKKKERKRWNERRVAARRVAELLHAMGIHDKNIPFASYAAVKKAWRKKMDDRDASSSDSEPEPEAKRPKCS